MSTGLGLFAAVPSGPEGGAHGCADPDPNGAVGEGEQHGTEAGAESDSNANRGCIHVRFVVIGHVA